jgi:hypothetical protein
VFFVRWFLPLPAVENLDEHHRWDFDDDEEDAPGEQLAAPSGPAAPPADSLPPPPAPEIRAPEGAEDRQPRQPNMPNPFA